MIRATILRCKYDEDLNVDYMIVFKKTNNLEPDTFRTWLKKFAEVNKINNNVRPPIRIKKYWNVLNSKPYASFELEQKNAVNKLKNAVLKQFPSCEFFPMEAVRTNVIGITKSEDMDNFYRVPADNRAAATDWHPADSS